MKVDHYTIDANTVSLGLELAAEVRSADEWLAGSTPSGGEKSLSSPEDESGKDGEREMPEEGSAEPANVRGGLGTKLGSRVALANSCLSLSVFFTCWSAWCPSAWLYDPRPDSDSASDSSRGGELLPSSLNKESRYWANSRTAWLGVPLDSGGTGGRVWDRTLSTSASSNSLSLGVSGVEPVQGATGQDSLLLGTADGWQATDVPEDRREFLPWLAGWSSIVCPSESGEKLTWWVSLEGTSSSGGVGQYGPASPSSRSEPSAASSSVRELSEGFSSGMVASKGKGRLPKQGEPLRAADDRRESKL